MFKVLLQTEAPATVQGLGNSGLWLMMLAVIVVMYFFMIRPQQKRQKELREFQNTLQKGKKVILSGGIYGKVVDVEDTYVMVEVDNNVKIKVDKGSVVRDPSDMPSTH